MLRASENLAFVLEGRTIDGRDRAEEVIARTLGQCPVPGIVKLYDVR